MELILTPENHFYGLIGSVVLIVDLLRRFYNAKVNHITRTKWSTYAKRNLFDFIWIIFIGQVIVFLQENIYQAYVSYQGNNVDLWDIYIDNELLISVCSGLFGTSIFSKWLKLGNKELRKTKPLDL